MPMLSFYKISTILKQIQCQKISSYLIITTTTTFSSMYNTSAIPKYNKPKVYVKFTQTLANKSFVLAVL